MEEGAFKKVLKTEVKQEIVSDDFTENVMQQVHQLSEKELVIEPLIPKKVWWGIAAGYILLIVFAFSVDLESNLKYLVDKVQFVNIDVPQLLITVELFFVLLVVFTSLTLIEMLYNKRNHKWRMV